MGMGDNFRVFFLNMLNHEFDPYFSVLIKAGFLSSPGFFTALFLDGFEVVDQRQNPAMRDQFRCKAWPGVITQ